MMHSPFSSIAECAEAVARLDDCERRRFYELLAHSLTVSARVVWSDDALSDSQKVEQLKQLNEKQHRVTGKLLNLHSWPDIEFITNLLQACSGDGKDIAGHVGWAVNRSYGSVKNISAK
jgi:hypothetical protein